MKNQGLVYLLLAGGVILFLSMRKKPTGRVFVPEPESITADQFKKPSLLQRVSKVVREVAPELKQAASKAKLKKAISRSRKANEKAFGIRGIGQFPNVC